MDILNHPDLAVTAPSLFGFLGYFAYHAMWVIGFVIFIGVPAYHLMRYMTRTCECSGPEMDSDRIACVNCRRPMTYEQEMIWRGQQEAFLQAATERMNEPNSILQELDFIPIERREAIRLRVMASVVIDPETGCWNWQGSDSGTGRGGGYPRMSLDGQTVAVHRVMFTNEHGYIPSKKQIDHKCENRMCVNPHPDHTEMVTHKENQKRKTKR